MRRFLLNFLAVRLDWGFGNANKTAALIVLLLVAVWALPFLHRHLFWPALAFSTGLGVCLMLTASRGGLVAAFADFAVLLYHTPRPWARPRIAGSVIAVWIVGGAGAWLPITQRLSKGISGEDLSVSQRLELWRAAPQMMVDAPGGWGQGRAAEVFHQWYQPLEHAQTFLSLVNSHLTWLTEMGWPARFLYVFGWLAILLVCWPPPAELPKARWLIVPFALWLGFAICAWFSSVAKSPWLWIIPIVSLLTVLAWRGYHNRWPRGHMWAAAALVSLATLGVLFVSGVRTSGPIHLRYTRGRVIVGSAPDPSAWVVTNDAVLGKSYGRALRKYLGMPDHAEQSKGCSLGFVTAVGELQPADVQGKMLVAAGGLDESQLAQLNTLVQSCSKLILLNPGFYPQQLEVASQASDKIVVITGEFSQAPATAWTEAMHRPTQSAEGAGDYLPRWPELVLANIPARQ